MKSALTFFVIVILSFGLSAQRPIAQYSFTAGTLDDKSITASHLESLLPVMTVDDYQGNPDNAISLLGNALFLEDLTQLRMTGQITVSARIKQNTVNAEWSAIINKWEENNGSYYLGINPATNTVRWNCFTGNIEDPATLPTGEWVHYTATYDGLEIKLYRDGQLANSSSVGEVYGESEVQFRIGAQSNNLVENTFFEGDIDEVRVFNIALTEEEVTDLYEDNLDSSEKDLALYDLSLGNAQIAPGKLKVKGTIANISDDEVSDIAIEVTAAGQTETFPISGLVLAPHDFAPFDIETGIDLEVGSELDVMATVIVDQDADLANNSRTESTNGYAFLPDRKVVMEEGTGTWCPWCPRGAVTMEELTEKYPDNFIGIAVHNADIMTNQDYDTSSDFGGYPQCHIDRVLRNQTINQRAGDSYVQSRLNADNVSPVAFSHTTSYFPYTRQLIVTSTVEPATPLSGFYTHSLIITEDGVTGTTEAYDQANNYAFNQNGPMGGYEDLGNPVPAAEMVYDHVARDVVGGYIGNSASLTRNLEVGETYSFTHIYTVPEEYNIENLNVVTLFIDAEENHILNAESSRIAEGMVSSTKDVASFQKLALYPNPSSGEAFIEMELTEAADIDITIQNTNGQVITQERLTKRNGYTRHRLATENCIPGIYLVGISIQGQTTTKKLIINK